MKKFEFYITQSRDRVAKQTKLLPIVGVMVECDMS